MNNKKKKKKRTVGVTQGVDTEFKPQYSKRKTIIKIKRFKV
jgi:hypothetical protein